MTGGKTRFDEFHLPRWRRLREFTARSAGGGAPPSVAS
jgi:hypothetical protein